MALEFYVRDSAEAVRARLPELFDWLGQLADTLKEEGLDVGLVERDAVQGVERLQRARLRTLNAKSEGVSLIADAGIARLASPTGLTFGVYCPHAETRALNPLLQPGYAWLRMWADSPNLEPLSRPVYLDIARSLAQASALAAGRGGVRIGAYAGFENRLGLRGLPKVAHRETIVDVTWVLWLTERHLEQLGGIDAVKSTAPVWQVSVFPEGVWLQATESPEMFDPEIQQALEHYLKPILITDRRLRDMPGGIDLLREAGRFGLPPAEPRPHVVVEVASPLWTQVEIELPGVDPADWSELTGTLEAWIGLRDTQAVVEEVGWRESTWSGSIRLSSMSRGVAVDGIQTVVYRLCLLRSVSRANVTFS